MRFARIESVPWKRTIRGGLSVVLLVLALAACAVQQPAPPPAQLKGMVKIAAGWTHSCALTSEGRVTCWGNNQDGQLGDGTRRTRRTSETVVGLLGTVKELTLGERHSCVLTSAGGVKCWGSNHGAQLGDGTRLDRVSPVEAGDIAVGLRMVTAGEHHTCVLTINGGVKCWGSNQDGQLADGTSEMRTKATQVSGLDRGVTAIAAGWRHTCALTTEGGVKCWGNNRDGQLGDGTAVSKFIPVDVVGLTNGVIAIAAGGRHSCAVIESGAVKCWGHNERGQLGDGTTADKVVPSVVSGLAEVSAIAAGWQHTCALTTGGAVKCWGNNEKGQVAGDAVFVKSVPATASHVQRPAVSIAAGGQHSCALTADSVVTCWGDDEFGQIGEALSLPPTGTRTGTPSMIPLTSSD